jgi:hypothetical protein
MINYFNNMNKVEIIAELDKLMYIAEQLENTFLVGRLEVIKQSLINDWNESDAYYELISSQLK